MILLRVRHTIGDVTEGVEGGQKSASCMDSHSHFQLPQIMFNLLQFWATIEGLLGAAANVTLPPPMLPPKEQFLHQNPVPFTSRGPH
jgi:hypothetical protein